MAEASCLGQSASTSVPLTFGAVSFLVLGAVLCFVCLEIPGFYPLAVGCRLPQIMMIKNISPDIAKCPGAGCGGGTHKRCLCWKPLIWGLERACRQPALPSLINKEPRSLSLRGRHQDVSRVSPKSRRLHLGDFVGAQAQAHKPSPTSVAALPPEESHHLRPIRPPD